MLGFAVVLLVVAVVVFAAGVVLFATGARVGTTPRGGEPGHGKPAKQELERLPWNELFSRMRTCVKTFTDPKARHDERLKASGAFCALTGIVLLCLAILAVIAAMA
jgi:hypothetical protein